jgi:hypothetical protein
MQHLEGSGTTVLHIGRTLLMSGRVFSRKAVPKLLQIRNLYQHISVFVI